MMGEMLTCTNIFLPIISQITVARVVCQISPQLEEAFNKWLVTVLPGQSEWVKIFNCKNVDTGLGL